MMQENTSFYGKIHTAGKTFAQLPVATVATNFISTQRCFKSWHQAQSLKDKDEDVKIEREKCFDAIF